MAVVILVCWSSIICINFVLNNISCILSWQTLAKTFWFRPINSKSYCFWDSVRSAFVKLIPKSVAILIYSLSVVSTWLTCGPLDWLFPKLISFSSISFILYQSISETVATGCLAFSVISTFNGFMSIQIFHFPHSLSTSKLVVINLHWNFACEKQKLEIQLQSVEGSGHLMSILLNQCVG